MDIVADVDSYCVAIDLNHWIVAHPNIIGYDFAGVFCHF